MIESDTIKLLRECDAGIDMGIASIDEVLHAVQAQPLRRRLTACRNEHAALQKEIESLLDRYQDEGKHPSPIAKGMSWIKTNSMLTMNDSDQTIASLMTDGCNMGIKSLNKYLNQYEAAEEQVKDMAKRLIHLEETLVTHMREYL